MYKKYNQLGENKQGNIEEKKLYPVLEIETQEQKIDLLRRHKIVCVDIYADWCQPCKMVAPTFAKLAERYNNESCILVKENFDKGFSTNLGINGIPCFIIYNSGKIYQKFVGADLEPVEDVLIALNQSYKEDFSDTGMNNYKKNYGSSCNFGDNSSIQEKEKPSVFNVGNRHRNVVRNFGKK